MSLFPTNIYTCMLQAFLRILFTEEKLLDALQQTVRTISNTKDERQLCLKLIMAKSLSQDTQSFA